ncbi:hypothetical protein ACS0VU_15080 [Aliiroseovarius sp. KMU-71]|uniref:hypothetical protein n=1 Tax=Aliiroseovarius sp. KMU-71 TaxID=3453123 RepID=UPI003F479BA8
MNRHRRALTRLAKAYGWRLETSSKGHPRLVDDRGGAPDLICSGTPRNAEHALSAIRRDLKKYRGQSAPNSGKNSDKPHTRHQNLNKNAKTTQPRVLSNIQKVTT